MKNKLFKLFMAGLLTTIVSTTMLAPITADADCIFGDAICDMMEGNSGDDSVSTLSFSDYSLEGGIDPLDDEYYDPSLTSEGGDLRAFILRIVNFALGFLGLIAVLIVIYGGVLYVTAGGEQEKTDKGKKAIMYATVGILIVMGSYAFVNTIIEAGGGDGSGGTGGGFGGSSASRNATSFNLAATQVQTIAKQIYDGFLFLNEATEELISIKNDAEKSSLLPDNFPDKNAMISFLSGTKGKLNRMSTSVGSLTQTETKINEIIRDIDKDIDRIKTKSGTEWLKITTEEGNEKGCSYDKWRGEKCDINFDGEPMACSVGFDQYCADEGFVQYTPGLYAVWKDIHQKYSDVTQEKPQIPSQMELYNLLVPLREDYFNKFTTKYIPELVEVWDFIRVVSAVGEGPAKMSFDTMLKEYIGFDYGNYAEGKVKTDSENLANSVDKWSFETIVSDVAANLERGLTAQADLYEEILNIEFVDARLNADVVTGNAPLTVTFTTYGTEDPAGGSLYGGEDLIAWDLSGQYIVELLELGEDYYEEQYGEVGDTQEIDTSKAVECDVIRDYAFGEVSGGDEGSVRGTAYRCTYHYPGTYNAAVKIQSREPKLYAPGIAVLPIVVDPPSTLINLQANGEDISKYGDSGDTQGFLEVDKRTVSFTVTEATSAPGIQFDASTSVPEPVKYKWDFGDGTIEEEASGKVSHIFDSAGKYTVTLEVTNNSGMEDRKIFTLIATNIVAKIASIDAPIYIKVPVTFDGSGSKSDVGTIREYKWEIYKKKLLGGWESVVAESGPSLRTFTYEFQSAWPSYKTVLTVTDDSGSTSEPVELQYSVISAPPLAIIDHEIPNELQPSTVHLDASRSYDPDGTEITDYLWSSCGSECEYIEGDETSVSPVVKFFEKGDYDMTLEITNADSETGEVEETIEITDVFDIAWGDDQEVTGIMGEEVTFEFVSDYAKNHSMAYEINFDDGNTDSGEFSGTGTETLTHTYHESGKKSITLTVYDEDDKDKTLKKKIFIGDGNTPVAAIKVMVDGSDLTAFYDGDDPIQVNRSDSISFDASDSKNVDGSAKDLRYSWDFGNNENSTLKIATHKYKEISPATGPYEVTLTVYDKDDPSKKATTEVEIDVINERPTFSALSGVVDANNPELITPVTVNLKVYDAEDPDGEIVQYKWWYFNVDDPEDPLGVQITTTPSAQITIGTDGKEGAERAYGYAVEITDSDNQKKSSFELYGIEEDSGDLDELLEDGLIPGIIVRNGANALPEAKFTVDKTLVFVGDTVRFTSASSDSDGGIESYIWDFEGDGFGNNSPTEDSMVEYSFETKNLQGYDVRLKVVDEKGGEATSDPITIYVDSHTQPPTAAFKSQVVPNTDGREIKFLNNSKADEEAGSEIVKYEWDFDTNVDTDGDGFSNNDVDSVKAEPKNTYSEYGEYTIKLTIYDNEGNSDDVSNTLTLPLANPPVAAFTYEMQEGGKVVFSNNSTSDTDNGAELAYYQWDFDTLYDSNGDGTKDNDIDSQAKSPSYTYPSAGTYKVRLIVQDDQGNDDDVVNSITVTIFGDGNTGDSGTGDSGDVSGGGTESNTLNASMVTSPAAQDGVVYIDGDSGPVTFDFSGSTGPVSYYILDKNIYYDTDGDGIKNNDQDFKTSLPGTWTTHFAKEWGTIVSRLMVEDIYGNTDSTTLEIKFK